MERATSEERVMRKRKINGEMGIGMGRWGEREEKGEERGGEGSERA